MRIVAGICNVALFLFVCVVLVTDGPSKETVYIVFSWLAVLIPILSAAVIFGSRASDGWLGLQAKTKAADEKRKIGDPASVGTILRIVTLVCNIVLFGFVCWAIADQYPHPEEEGVVAFTLLIVLTPILSSVVILRGLKGHAAA